MDWIGLEKGNQEARDWSVLRSESTQRIGDFNSREQGMRNIERWIKRNLQVYTKSIIFHSVAFAEA